MSRVRTVFIGSGRFGVESLRRLARDPDTELVGVVTEPPRPSGRHLAVTATPVDEVARELSVAEVLRPARLREPAAIAAVLSLEPALAVLADYGQLVPRPILELPLGALNLHPSLLPRHRGAAPIQATILAGDRETGVSLMRMDEGLDTGPIIATARVQLAGTESTPELEARLADAAADLLADTVGPWIRGELAARAQPSEGATLTRPLHRADGRLDSSHGAARLERQVRALAPWPGTFVEGPDGRIVVHAAHVEPAERDDQPGRLVASGDGLALATVDGRLVLDDVQPAGGRRMSAAALRRGRPKLLEPA